MRVILERLETSDQGTFGRLIAPDLVVFTGELPWRGNASMVSCIPEGLYRAAWTWSPSFRRFLYAIYPVDGRSGIRVHGANFMGDISMGYRSQLNGCVALGERLGTFEGQKAVLLSAPAMRRFEKVMGYEPFEIEIRGSYV